MRLQILSTDSGTHTDSDLNMLRSVIDGTEYTIGKHTSDLNEAVRLVRNGQFDILICFNHPPEYIATKMLRLTGSNKEHQIPTIVISPQDDSQRMRECFLLGAIDFLSAPIPPEDMLTALSRAADMIHSRLIKSEYRAALELSITQLPQSEQNAPIITKLEEFLLQYQEQTATAQLAADYFGFNRDYFGRYFKGKFGLTFGEFYKTFQMQYARLLLETGQFKVQEVSSLLGFSTPDYFTRVFKARTGRIPSELKK